MKTTRYLPTGPAKAAVTKGVENADAASNAISTIQKRISESLTECCQSILKDTNNFSHPLLNTTIKDQFIAIQAIDKIRTENEFNNTERVLSELAIIFKHQTLSTLQEEDTAVGKFQRELIKLAKYTPPEYLGTFLRMSLADTCLDISTIWGLYDNDPNGQGSLQRNKLYHSAIHFLATFFCNSDDCNDIDLLNALNNTFPLARKLLLPNELGPKPGSDDEQYKQLDYISPEELQDIIAKTEIDNEQKWQEVILARALLQLMNAEMALTANGQRSTIPEAHAELVDRFDNNDKLEENRNNCQKITPNTDLTILAPELTKRVNLENPYIQYYILPIRISNDEDYNLLLEIASPKTDASLVRKQIAKASETDSNGLKMVSEIKDHLRLRAHIPNNVEEEDIETLQAICIATLAEIMSEIGTDYKGGSEHTKWTFGNGKSSRHSLGQFKAFKTILTLKTSGTEEHHVEVQIARDYPNDHEKYTKRQNSSALKKLGLPPEISFDQMINDAMNTFLAFSNNIDQTKDKTRNLIFENFNYYIWLAKLLINTLSNPENEHIIKNISVNQKNKFCAILNQLQKIVEHPTKYSDGYYTIKTEDLDKITNNLNNILNWPEPMSINIKELPTLSDSILVPAIA